MPMILILMLPCIAQCWGAGSGEDFLNHAVPQWSSRGDGEWLVQKNLLKEYNVHLKQLTGNDLKSDYNPTAHNTIRATICAQRGAD